MNIMLSERDSIIFFYGVIILSAIIAGVGNYSKKQLNPYIGKLCIFVSFLILFIPLGFRKVGIDHEVYLEWFEKADYWLLKNYQLTPEPFFAGITLLAKNVFNQFQVIYLLAAFVYLFGIHKFLNKTESLGFVSLFFYNVSIYLYMCGLARISFALGILAIGYTYIDTPPKFILFAIIAMMFHYTSVIALIVLFSYKSKKRFALKNIVYIIIGIYVLSYIINRFADRLPYVIARYAGYVQFSFSFYNITSCVIIIPAIIIWFVFSRDYAILYDQKFRMYDNIMKTLIVLIFISMAFEGTFRLTFYFYPFVAKIYYDFSRVLVKSNGGMLRVIYPALFAMVGLIYVYAVFFTSPFITPLIIPFKL